MWFQDGGFSGGWCSTFSGCDWLWSWWWLSWGIDSFGIRLQVQDGGSIWVFLWFWINVMWHWNTNLSWYQVFMPSVCHALNDMLCSYRSPSFGSIRSIDILDQCSSTIAIMKSEQIMKWRWIMNNEIWPHHVFKISKRKLWIHCHWPNTRTIIWIIFIRL